jgi:hypothetical protein
LEFDVKSYRDLTADQIIDVLSETSKFEFPSNPNGIIIIILSHGGDNGLICGKDYNNINGKESGFVTVSQIVNIFNDDNCPTLKAKPKMFFLSACRGGLRDRVKSDAVIAFQNESKLSHVFIGFGTQEGMGFKDLFP